MEKTALKETMNTETVIGFTNRQIDDLNENLGKARAMVDLLAFVDGGAPHKETLGWSLNAAFGWINEAIEIINKQGKRL